MARFSARVPRCTFGFSKELGLRLAALRRRAGLSQTELAYLMGRKGRGAATLVSRLELARSRSPSLGTVCDYLRACGARFSDIAEILDRFTAMPAKAAAASRRAAAAAAVGLPEPAVRQVLKYELAARERVGARAALPGETRARNALTRRYADATKRREELRRFVVAAIDRQPLGLRVGDERQLQQYAQRLVRILRRAADRPPAERAAPVAGALANEVARRGASEEQLVVVTRAAVEFAERAAPVSTRSDGQPPAV